MAQISWQKTVTTAGTAVTGPDTGAGTFLIMAKPGNTGTYCYIGEDGAGDVSSTTGYILEKSVNAAILTVNNMNTVYFDTDTSGDGVSILKISGPHEGLYPPVL